MLRLTRSLVQGFCASTVSELMVVVIEFWLAILELLRSSGLVRRSRGLPPS